MSVTDLEAWDYIGQWLVRFGVWDDEGRWADTGVWVDEPDPWLTVAENANIWGEP